MWKHIEGDFLFQNILSLRLKKSTSNVETSEEVNFNDKEI